MSDLVGFLSNRFDITINPVDIEGLETVGDLIALVEDSLLE